MRTERHSLVVEAGRAGAVAGQPARRDGGNAGEPVRGTCTLYRECDRIVVHEVSAGGSLPTMVAALRACADSHARERIVRAAVHAIGFEWLGYGTTQISAGRMAWQGFETTYASLSWVKPYFEQAYSDIDMRYRMVRCSGFPLVWDLRDLQAYVGARAMSLRERSFLNDMADHGLGSGIFVCLGAPTWGERVFISFASPTPSRHWITDTIVGQALTLGLCLHEFWSRYTRIRVAETGASIDMNAVQQRIVECLLRGASDKQIAGELNLGLHGVDYHLRQLRRRFGVTNRVQLVSAMLTNGGRSKVA